MAQISDPFRSRSKLAPKVRRLAALLAASLVLDAAAPDRAVTLSAQPGSALEAAASALVRADLDKSKADGEQPLLLVGSGKLAAGAGQAKGNAALFVQVQSPGFCGSAGCSTTVYVKHGHGWTKVLDSVSGPIRISSKTHRGMHDLIVGDHDRWVWTGSAYADTLPMPAVALKAKPR